MVFTTEHLDFLIDASEETPMGIQIHPDNRGGLGTQHRGIPITYDDRGNPGLVYLVYYRGPRLTRWEQLD